jgi:hypothetical protein
MESLFWVTLVAEALALMHTRLKKFVEGPIQSRDVIEGVGRVVGASDERRWVRHDWYVDPGVLPRTGAWVTRRLICSRMSNRKHEH